MSDVRTEETRQAGRQDREGPNPQGDFIWYELMTPDADAAGRFYSAVVPGWSFGERMPGDVDYRGIQRSDGGNAGGVLQLDDSMRTHGARPMWLGYVHAHNVDDKVASIERAGGKALMPAFDVPHVGRIAMVADPQGAPFYVMKPTPPADKPDAASDVFSPTQPQRVSWNELNTSDPAAARRFYGEQFGWTSDEFMPMGEMGEYRFWMHEGLALGAVCGLMGQQQPKWRFYFRVPSIAEAKAAVEASGGRITNGPHEVPGGDQVIIGIDPQGAEFALVGGA
jgi:predicted enzyme related to lactoylglutathione lyase